MFLLIELLFNKKVHLMKNHIFPARALERGVQQELLSFW